RNNELLSEQAAKLPAIPEVPQQRLALELHQDIDGVDTRIDEIAKYEVNDAVFPAERHGRLGACSGQRQQAVASPTGEYKCDDWMFHGRALPRCLQAGAKAHAPGDGRPCLTSGPSPLGSVRDEAGYRRADFCTNGSRHGVL